MKYISYIMQSGSQSSRREYKRFAPKDVSESSLNKKRLLLNMQSPKNLNIINQKSHSKSKEMSNSQISMPNLSINRNSSHTILRAKPEERKAEKPPLAPKNVRFTFGKPGDINTNLSQVVNKVISEKHS
jgi:hypothetical protein